MMYFRALTQGLADLPAADSALRQQIDAEAEKSGWPALHAQLEQFDPMLAARLSPNDSQRIQRGIEVYRLSGTALSEWQARGAAPAETVEYLRLALQPEPRSVLHERIEQRLNMMINNGFLDEVNVLRSTTGAGAGCGLNAGRGLPAVLDACRRRMLAGGRALQGPRRHATIGQHGKLPGCAQSPN